jgi:hypothetical protein
MSFPGRVAAEHIAAILTSPGGLAARLATIASREGTSPLSLAEDQIRSYNIAADLAEKTAGVHYPAIYIYCERVANDLREKFRTFAGRATLVIEARVSKDRLEELDRDLHILVEAITGVLDVEKGDWGDGLCYPGGYEITFGPVKHGGKNFLQSAKIMFDVDVRRD